MNQKQKGLASVMIIGLVILVLALVSGACVGYYLLNKNKSVQLSAVNQNLSQVNQGQKQQAQLFKNYIGNKLGDMKLVSDDGNVCKFSGAVEISGTYFRDKIFQIGKADYNEETCIEVDKNSYLKMPILDVSNRVINLGNSNTDLLYNPKSLLCFNESENSKKLAFLKDSGEATVLIDNYQVDYSADTFILANPKADLVRVVKEKSKHVFSDVSTWEKYNNEKYAYSFKIIPSYSISDYSELIDNRIGAIAITNRAGTWSSSLCECGEGGAVIRVSVWDSEDLALKDWFNKHLKDEYLIGEIKDIEIDGIKGLKAEIGEMGGGPDIVIERDGLIFEIRGIFIDSSSEEFRDFISNFKFL
jgi:uncharacterized protein (UPF0333 family)